MVQTSPVRRSCECGPQPTRESRDPATKRTLRRAGQYALVSPISKTPRRTRIQAALANVESMFRLCALLHDSPSHSVEHATHINVHADPFRTRAAVTINAAINVVPFDADVFSIRTAIAPPLGWSKESDDRCARGNRNVRRSGVAANVNSRTFRESVEAFQRQVHRSRFFCPRCSCHFVREIFFTGSVRYQGSHSVTGPKQIAQCAKFFRAPQLGRPSASGIEYRVVSSGALRGSIRFRFSLARDADRE